MNTKKSRVFTPGNVIEGKWVVLECIGKGAMGEVYRAHQLNLQRDVAVKVISQELLESIEENEQEVETALQRFRREVQSMARIRHPNVLQIYDHGSVVVQRGADEYPVEFIVMEYIPGDTLRYTMSEEGFYPEHTLVKNWLENYYLPMLEGVRAIHAMDIVHRDLKPENFLMDGNIPKLTDFGLARSDRLESVTQSMDVKGTVNYMSPEHFFDFRKTDQRADIYSLGKILYEAIDGKIGEKTLPFKNASLPNPDTFFFQKMDEIIRNATAENKEERLNSVDKLYDALRDAIDILDMQPGATDHEKPSRLPFFHNTKWVWAGIFAALLSVAAMTLWHLAGEPGKSTITSKSVPALSIDRQSIAGSGIPIEDSMGQTTPTTSMLTNDGSTLRLIPGGKITLPGNIHHNSERSINVDSFYIDEAPVTNHQYVQFLNQNLSTLFVAKGVVRQDDEIWLLLGDIFKEYNPIIFREGKFHVSRAAYASFPVLRVTADGASAYARFYNRRLPGYEEWLHAMGNNEKTEVKSEPNNMGPNDALSMQYMHNRMMGDQSKTDKPPEVSAKRLSPVSGYVANKYGVRFMDNGFGEWSLRGTIATSRQSVENLDYILVPSGVMRQPWEAFEEVGFRCSLSAVNGLNKADFDS
jgi:serine/threonine-protein kinase